MHTLEAQQQALLQALLTPGALSPDKPLPEGLQPFIAGKTHPSSARGLNCYQANAHAMAERALGAAYPVVTTILSPDSMAQLARALWHGHPPTKGDLAQWGAALPGFMASSPQLAAVPWLSDLARVEWALHEAEAAPDALANLDTLGLLATQDPDRLTLRLAPGLQVLDNPFAVVPAILAHRQPSAQAQAVAIGQLGDNWCPARTEHARVWRVGHLPPQVCAISDAEAALLDALLGGVALLPALESCELDFTTWLPSAVQQGVVLGVKSQPCLGAQTIGPSLAH